MYVIYFAGDSATNLILQRPLGRLRWNWGGWLFSIQPAPTLAHHLRSTNALPQSRTGEPTTSTVNMQGELSKVDVPCPGGPPLTANKIDSSRNLVRWYYKDILLREPDAGGLDWHTSAIAQCVLDWNCIPMRRSQEALGFFFSQEFMTLSQDPIMASPPGHPNFNAAVYNPAFITWCYRLFLGRDPEPEGLSNWTKF